MHNGNDQAFEPRNGYVVMHSGKTLHRNYLCLVQLHWLLWLICTVPAVTEIPKRVGNSVPKDFSKCVTAGASAKLPANVRKPRDIAEQTVTRALVTYFQHVLKVEK